MWWLLACVDSDVPDEKGAPDLCTETPGSDYVSLPADDAAHTEPIEWWYWTGHLHDDAGRWYGFEEVFFLFDGAFQMGNTALTDIDGDAFSFDVRVASSPDVADEGFDWDMDGWTAKGGGGDDALAGDAGDYAWTLALTEGKAPVLEHGDGYTDYDFGGNTYYYSRTRMEASGTLTVAGADVPVEGTAWFDHQWGELETAASVGWDWFALQLDDGREVMVFDMRPEGRTEEVGGTLVGADCAASEVDATVTSTGTWENADGCSYPSGWTVEVDGMTLTLTPVRADQELALSRDRYWEGAVEVTGDATGRGYVELTGYCD